MKTLIAKSISSRNFRLEDENAQNLGELIYPKWYSTQAEIKIESKIFRIDRKGFWTTSIEIFEYEKLLMKFKMDWKGNIIMTSFLNGEKHFIIKKEKWFSETLLMKDEYDKIYLKLKRSFKWKDFKYYYDIALEEELQPVEILGIIHVVNYFNSQEETAAASTAAI